MASGLRGKKNEKSEEAKCLKTGEKVKRSTMARRACLFLYLVFFCLFVFIFVIIFSSFIFIFVSVFVLAIFFSEAGSNACMSLRRDNPDATLPNHTSVGSRISIRCNNLFKPLFVFARDFMDQSQAHMYAVRENNDPKKNDHRHTHTHTHTHTHRHSRIRNVQLAIRYPHGKLSSNNTGQQPPQQSQKCWKTITTKHSKHK